MSKNNTKSVRYHFTAPVSDTQLAEWAEKQHNFSVSVRIVLKDFIARHGMIDASCLALSFDNKDTVLSEVHTAVQQPVAEPSPEPVTTPVAETVTEKVPETIAEPEPEPVKQEEQAEKKEETTTASSMASSMLDDLMG